MSVPCRCCDQPYVKSADHLCVHCREHIEAMREMLAGCDAANDLPERMARQWHFDSEWTRLKARGLLNER